jgi:hypothetical protein
VIGSSPDGAKPSLAGGESYENGVLYLAYRRPDFAGG